MHFQIGRWLEVQTGGARNFTPGPSAVAPWDGYGWNAVEPQPFQNYLSSSVNVYACAQLRAETLASLPLKIYNGVGEDRAEVESGPARDLFDRVNPFWTFNRLIAMTELSLSLWGESYWFVERDGAGVPIELWWARSDRVTVVPSSTDYIAGYLLARKDGTGDPLAFTTDEVVRFAYPNPADEFSGLSPLASAYLSVDVGINALRSNSQIFTQGMQPGGAILPPESAVGISTTLTDGQVTDLENTLRRRFSGEANRHKWAVFKHRFDVVPFTMSAKDMEFMGTLAWSLEDTCRAYRIPLDLVGGQRTYENVQAAERALWARFGLPEAQFIATEITEQLLPAFGAGLVAEFDVSEVVALQDDEDAEWARAEGQIAAGAITVEEWRADKGLDPKEATGGAFRVGDITAILDVATAWGSGRLPTEAAAAILENVIGVSGEAVAAMLAVEPSAPLALPAPDAEDTLTESRAYAAVVGVLGRIQDSTLDKLGEQMRRDALVPASVFDAPKWRVAITEAVEPHCGTGAEAVRRAQRIADVESLAIHRAMTDSLVEGKAAAESPADLAARVEAVIRERKEALALEAIRTCPI